MDQAHHDRINGSANPPIDGRLPLDLEDFRRLQPGSGARPPRQNTLAALRWAALFGQSTAVGVAVTFLEMHLPLGACALAILIGAAFNLATNTHRGGPRRRLTQRDAFLSLLFDLGQLIALLYLTGGLANPFALFLLAPVTISALTLSIWPTIALGLICMSGTALLAVYHIPLTTHDGQPPDDSLLLAGFWTAIAIGVAFQAVYARRIAADNHAMTTALAATQMALERELRLSAIGAMAAAAAHELGTPLATIKVAASELKKELKDEEELAEDAALISDQAARCREILARLSALREEPRDAELETAPISAVLDEAAAPHRGRGARIVMRVNGANADPAMLAFDATAPQPPQPQISMRPEIIHGLRNLIQNAVDFARSKVWIDVYSGKDGVTVQVGDDGPGFSSDILAKIGEPYATTRPHPRGASESVDGYFGMGLGVFISKTLLERTGARMSFRNAPRNDEADDGEFQEQAHSDPLDGDPSGAIVSVHWPTGSSAL